MARLKIHGEKEMPEPEINLRLGKDEQGVAIICVDTKGEPIKGGTIMRILNDGSLVRVPGLSDKLGLKLNDKKQILMKSVE